MTGMRLRRLVLAIGLVVAAYTAVALAFWSAPGAGVASAASRSFDPGTISAQVSGNSITVTWTNQASLVPPSPHDSAITSSVERRLGSGSWAAVVGGGCSGAMPYAVTTCVDAPAVSGSYSYRAVASYHMWTATSGEAGPVSLTIDTTTPTVDARQTPAPNDAGWSNSAPVAVELSADDGGGSGVDAIAYTTDGSDPTSSGTAQVYTTALPIGATTTVRYFVTDLVGNASTVRTEQVKIDDSAPANAVTLSSVSGGAFKNGTIVYYRGSAPGSFTLTNAVNDSGPAGAASSTTAQLSGSSAGWTHSPSSVSLPAGGPYVSNAFSWSALTTSSPGVIVTGSDAADNTAATALTFTDDSTPPAGGAVGATGVDGGYSTSTSLSIALTPGTDTGAGLATTGAKLMRASALLTDGGCGTYGSYLQVGADDPASPVADTVPDMTCYRYLYVVADRVGNETTYTSPDIAVDAAGPSGGTVDALGLVGTAGRYATSTALSIALDEGHDVGSGLAATGAQLRRATATLSSAGANGNCGSYGVSARVGADDPVSPVADTVPVGEACYRYEYVVHDAAGNARTYTSPDIKIDTTVPATPTLAFSEMDHSYSPGGASPTVYYAAAAASGSFTVTAASTDTSSGIAGYNLPTFGAGWTTTATGAGVRTYSWSAANPTAPDGAQDVSAANGAALTSGTTAFTLVADDTAPSGGTITYADGDTAGPSVSVGFTPGSDGGSGLKAASGELQRAEATLTGATCGSYGSFDTVTGATDATSPFVDDSVMAGTCYQYRYLQSDNVDNQVIYTSSAVARVPA
jgi:hypothetical protein